MSNAESFSVPGQAEPSHAGAGEGAGRRAWGVGCGHRAWGVGRGAWSVGREAWGAGRGAWGVGHRSWAVGLMVHTDLQICVSGATNGQESAGGVRFCVTFRSRFWHSSCLGLILPELIVFLFATLVPRLFRYIPISTHFWPICYTFYFAKVRANTQDRPLKSDFLIGFVCKSVIFDTLTKPRIIRFTQVSCVKVAQHKPSPAERK